MSQRDRLLAVVDDDLQQDCGDYLALRELMQELYGRLLEREGYTGPGLTPDVWLAVISQRVPSRHVELNRRAFETGRAAV